MMWSGWSFGKRRLGEVCIDWSSRGKAWGAECRGQSQKYIWRAMRDHSERDGRGKEGATWIWESESMGLGNWVAGYREGGGCRLWEEAAELEVKGQRVEGKWLHFGDSEFKVLEEHSHGEFRQFPWQLGRKFRNWDEKHRYENNCYKNVSRRARVKDKMQDWLHGTVTEGPMLSLMLCCHCLEILWVGSPAFLFCTGNYKLY